MGAQCYTSRSISDTLNPKWNFNCQFFIRDIYQDVLCLTVFEKDQFSPDGEFVQQPPLYSRLVVLNVSCLFKIFSVALRFPWQP